MDKLSARVWGERHWAQPRSRVTCHVYRCWYSQCAHTEQCSSCARPGLGQDWARTRAQPSPARAACSLEQLLVSPGWAGLGWSARPGHRRSSDDLLSCLTSGISLILATHNIWTVAPFKLPSIRQRGPTDLHPTFHTSETLQTSLTL